MNKPNPTHVSIFRFSSLCRFKARLLMELLNIMFASLLATVTVEKDQMSKQNRQTKCLQCLSTMYIYHICVYSLIVENMFKDIISQGGMQHCVVVWGLETGCGSDKFHI